MVKRTDRVEGGSRDTQKSWLSMGILIALWIIFFYKFFLFGLIPFPGDLLVSTYQPWKSYSYLGYNPGSYPTKYQYFDTIRQTYPWRILAINNLKNNTFPLWNPYNFSGSPLFANIQSAVLYPGNILFFITDDITSWSLLVALQPFLASVFMYLYCRTLRIGRTGALIASISYGYSLFTSVFLEYNTMIHTILWLPAILYCIELLIFRWRILPMLCLVAALVFSAFAGHLQLFGLMISFVLMYCVFRIWSIQTDKRKIVLLLKLGAVGTLGGGIALIQLLPTLELIGQSARVPHDPQQMISQFLIQPWQISLFLIPDLYGNPATGNYMLPDSYPGNALYIGIVPIILAFVALFYYKSNKIIAFFAGALALLLLLIIRNVFSEYIFTKLPLFSASSPGNMLFMTSFTLAVLAGFGMDKLRVLSTQKLFMVTGILGIIGCAWVTGGHEIYTKSLIFSGALFGMGIVLVFLYRAGFLGIGMRALMILFLVGDLMYFFMKFNSFVPRELVYPDAGVLLYIKDENEYGRFWGYGPGGIEANFASYYHVYSPDGYDPLYPMRYGQFMGASEKGKLRVTFDASNRSDAVIAQGSGEVNLSENTSRLRVLDTLGVYLLLDRAENASTERTFPSHRFNPSYNQDGWVVYTNTMAVSRARLVHHYAVAKTPDEFNRIFFDPSFDIYNSVVLSSEPSIIPQSCEGVYDAKITSYDENSLSIATKSPCPSLLVVSDTLFPGWHARVDGADVEIITANWAFRSVPLTAGEHRIVFTYNPPSFSTGIKIAIMSISILIAWVVFEFAGTIRLRRKQR